MKSEYREIWSTPIAEYWLEDPKLHQMVVDMVNQKYEGQGSSFNIMEDKDGNLVYLAQSEWFLNTERQNNPKIEFHFTSEFKTAMAK